MIRILNVVTDMGRGGLETMIMNYYRKIDRSKLQFDFIVHREKRETYDDEIESLGGKIYRLPRLNPFSMQYRKKLGDFFDNHPEYQIIHVHQDCLSSVILKIALEHGVKVRIAHSHSSSQNKNIKYPIKLFYKKSIKKYATDLLACSEEAGRWMFNSDDFEVLNNAIDAKRYIYDEHVRLDARSKLGIKDDELVIGHVGRFSPPKNHEFLIDIFNEIQKKRKAKLLLVGDGSLRTSIEEKVNRLELKDKVIFAGIQPNVDWWLQAMDIFLFPSIYEGLPLTIVEAQASGLRCYISDKVPIECKKTDLVEQICLSEGAQKWAQIILEKEMYDRRNTYEEICEAGFDVDKNAKWVEQYYISKEERINGV